MSGTRQSWSSSASEDDQRYAGMDEKKRKRMISNRESARRSRMKKQRLLQELTGEVGRLEAANGAILEKIDEMRDKCGVLADHNNVLRAQILELAERLKYLNHLIKNNGLDLDIMPNVADPLMKKPWRNLFPLLPIPASSSLFKF